MADEPTGKTMTSKTVTLKDGTVKTYTYERKFIKKTKNIHNGKEELRHKITACKDKEKIDKLKQYMNELEM